jgi:NADH-quinone oxidoreductase subunit M
MLAWTIYISFAGAALCLVAKGQGRARLVALASTLAALVIVVADAFQGHGGQLRTIARVDWIPSLGIEYYLAADGISFVLVLLTALAALAGVLFSWNIEHRVCEFFAFYLVLIGAVHGVFLSFDLFLLFVFYEIAIIPKYFLIALWGSTRRDYAAMKLALYSLVGSALVLAGMVAAYVTSGAQTMDLQELAAYDFPRQLAMWAFPAVFVGFAFLAGLWPFHTWAPTGHVAAPTAASMLLAGVVMKLGAYGCLRVAMPLFEGGMAEWEVSILGISSWKEVFSWLAVIGIVYGAFVALVQRDFKFVVGYSSVSHMGFVLLGMLTLHRTGLSGSVFQMFSHGVIAGLLFAVVGRMVYDRTHTRDLAELPMYELNRALPFAAVTFVIASLAGMGLPGFSGFVAELQVMVGSWHAFPTLAVLAGVGVLLSAAYSLRALQKAFFEEPRSAAERGHSSPPGSANAPGDGEKRSRSEVSVMHITLPEKLGAVLLMGTSLAVGVYPDLLLRWIIPALETPFFRGLIQGGAQ